ncbi:hypothetical protein ACJIZ3_015138 [Penstemon smallii]|uniref:Uncharacterized protein n=1 Tax=Penstemon smallii TaxID=265156 RepID=A0ABD3RUL9_9LAMI
MGLWESEIGLTNSSLDEDTISTNADESGAPCCRKGEHDLVLDEQIGLVCKYCHAVILDIKDIMPPFSVESPERRSAEKRERKDSDSEETKNSMMNQIQFQSSAFDTIKSSIQSNGTVLDLIPNDKNELYPHQREGFEFMWKNIAGDTQIKNLLQLPADSGGGCIISHAPGTGKTRLTIVFLQSFLKLYPACRPVIIAPKGMLLTWEQEFKKWEVAIKFHNLNESKLSRQETEIAGSVLGQTRGHKNNTDYVRLLKLYSWMKGGSVLGISYRLFEQLAGEDKEKGSNKKFRKILLELPGLLVLDEGHTPRNSQSLMWKALTKVMTQRRAILSGTPFQNNFSELYNTLCLVNPRFSKQIMETGFDAKVYKRKRKGKCNAERGEWDYLTNSISKNNNDDQAIKKLGLMMKPFVHIHKGSILQKTLPGIRDCLILLRPTDIQRELLLNISKVEKFLDQAYLASLISIHPSLAAKNPEFSVYKKRLNKIESDPNAGVKTRFLIELIRVSARLNEKVLIFSQFIDPLHHIQNLLKSHFSWNEGKEVIYMDGDLGLKQRQISINSFNDKTGGAKVMLASQRACSEGISLVGASRVVLLDVVWNPAVERQAISRAYRIGQEKVVYVYHLVTLMEVKKFARQVEKERISELIFSKENGGERSSCCNDVVKEDQVLEAMVGHSSLSGMFEKIVHQPKESDLVDTFGFVDL